MFCRCHIPFILKNVCSMWFYAIFSWIADCFLSFLWFKKRVSTYGHFSLIYFFFSSWSLSIELLNFQIFCSPIFHANHVKLIIEIVLYIPVILNEKQNKNMTFSWWVILLPVRQHFRRVTWFLHEYNHLILANYFSVLGMVRHRSPLTSNLYLYINENLSFVHGHFHSFMTDSF